VDTVARRAGVPVGDLIAANRLTPPYTLRSGQLLALPVALRHRVKSGETAYGIARLFGVDMRTLVQLNGIRPPYAVTAGQMLLVPPPPRTGGDEPASSDRRVAAIGPVPLPAEAAPPPAPPVERTFSALPPPRPGTPAIVDDPPPRAGSVFLWPVRGRILASYGPQSGGLHNDGINIGAPRGTAVRAAENGIVVYAGNEIPGFGNLVMLRHDGGWMTAYGHVDAMRVRRGDTVRRGQTIATVGQTGGVTQPQLHFEIRRGSSAVDPGRYLDGGAGPGISSDAGRAVLPGPG
jgi:murein DD-endopeptidase MepM/ murein hydrolase activator NlpD